MVMHAPPRPACTDCGVRLEHRNESGLCRDCIEDARLTVDGLDALIESRRATMPQESEKPRTAKTRRQPTATKTAPNPCAVLDHLIASGTGGFTRALMEADKYLREHPEAEVVQAHANREQTVVRLRFVGGHLLTFTGGVCEAREHLSRNVVAAHRRLLLLKFLSVNGPSSITEIADGVGLPAERCRELIRTCEWFAMIPGRRKIDMRYAVSATGDGRYRKDTGRMSA